MELVKYLKENATEHARDTVSNVYRYLRFYIGTPDANDFADDILEVLEDLNKLQGQTNE